MLPVRSPVWGFRCGDGHTPPRAWHDPACIGLKTFFNEVLTEFGTSRRARQDSLLQLAANRPLKLSFLASTALIPVFSLL
jgi:hypothetical protein